MPDRMRINNDVLHERRKQERVYEEQRNIEDGTGGADARCRAHAALFRYDRAESVGALTWGLVLDAHCSTVLAEADTAKLREELVSMAAVTMRWIEAIDRRNEKGDAA